MKTMFCIIAINSDGPQIVCTKWNETQRNEHYDLILKCEELGKGTDALVADVNIFSGLKLGAHYHKGVVEVEDENKVSGEIPLD